ncbi:hypothetical protein BJX68DRAFT_222846 [Aspergillus pseudodeflectus]|uniref:Uncharacterized protein n=1 Tax=Aspergillus pseudodeflectus TaxID=176178 RepID=A0ABR4LAK9_9EURO
MHPGLIALCYWLRHHRGYENLSRFCRVSVTLSPSVPFRGKSEHCHCSCLWGIPLPAIHQGVIALAVWNTQTYIAES